MRLAFAGTPEFARVALARLHGAGFEVVLVLSQPDRPAGRGLKVAPSPVKAVALDQGLAGASAGALQARLASLGGTLIVEALGALAKTTTLSARPQPEVGVTYAAKITKAEATIDWRAPAAEIERRLRAFDPAPGARSTLA